MRLLVLGGEGWTGRHVVEQALGHGHDVTALPDADLRDALADAVLGQDAVVSTLVVDGLASGGGPEDVTADLVRSMTARGVTRLVVASRAGAGGHHRELALAHRATLVFPFVRDRIAVADRAEGDVMLSDLDWTIVRVHMLSDGPRTGHYRVVEGPVVPNGASMPRGDLAAFLVKTAESRRYLRRVVAVAR